MSIAPEEKPPSLPERYVLGTPRIQLDPIRISRLASLGLPRRVPCGDHWQGSFPAESLNGNSELPSFREERPARCQDSVAKSSLSSADSSEARKRKADRDAPICRERTLARQEEGRVHPSSRSNLESVADLRNHSSAKELLRVQDKENINPFSDPRIHEPKKLVSDRSQEKRRLQVSKSSQNVPSGRKVGSLLVKQSIKLKSHKPIEGGFQASVISQDGSIERKQVQQINTASSKVCSTVESMSCVEAHGQADSDMYILGDFMNNSQPLQVGCDVSVNSKRQNVSPTLQEQDGSKISSSVARHAEMQDMRGRSVLPESNQRGVVLTSVKDLSSSMNSLAIGDSPQADEKRDLLISSKIVQGSFVSDEKTHEANFAPAACPSLPALSVPSATAWSYTIRTGSAPVPTSHTVESVQPLGQQNVQPSSKDNSILRFQANCAIAASKEEEHDVKQAEKPSLVRPSLVENEVIKLSQERPFHDNLPISDVGAGKLIQPLHLPENKCTGGESSIQPRKQGESEHFVWVNRRRYQKLKKIGRGGSSEVYKVIDRDGNIYALKRIKLKGRDYATAYGFYQEIELLTKLQGKSYIIRLIDHEVTEKNLFSLHFEASQIVRHDAYIYMVLEYGEVDLATMLQEKFKEIGPGNNVDETWLRFYWLIKDYMFDVLPGLWKESNFSFVVSQQILEAVNTVHEERIIHADLKPANFLLVRGVLKLIDFGIAKSIQGDTTNIQRDAQVGTLNYMSPEAFLMNEKDEYGNVIKCGRPSDIWALGCILYQMVYGKTPFAHITALHARIQEVANPNHKINFPPVSNPHLLDIMKKCLAYKREERLRIPELLNHPFLQPQMAQSMEAENLSQGVEDIKALTRLLKRRILSQVEAEKQQGNHVSAVARFLEQLMLFEEHVEAVTVTYCETCTVLASNTLY